LLNVGVLVRDARCWPVIIMWDVIWNIAAVRATDVDVQPASGLPGDRGFMAYYFYFVGFISISAFVFVKMFVGVVYSEFHKYFNVTFFIFNLKPIDSFVCNANGAIGLVWSMMARHS
jgi:hypothetical protein